MLLASCEEELQRIIDGRQQSIGEALAIERQQILPVPGEGFDLVTLGDQLELMLDLLRETDFLEDDAGHQDALPPNVIPFRPR